LVAELKADAALVQPVPPGVRPRPWMANGPLFPRLWTATPAQGEALVEIIIDRQGRAQLPKVMACTAPEFGAAAAQAVAAWRFFPLRASDKPIVTRVQIPFGFDRTKESGSVR
jgi:TonB family protein